ncbi:MAG: excinuclease ABC subunit UvrC [Candidatus Latescibacteria bacterium]|nr:excinuclease ABC subunit UvrC [Candidatus Latescibacterota bacterium]
MEPSTPDKGTGDQGPGNGEAPTPDLDWRTELQERLDHLPKEPGAYLMKDAVGIIIYVGKAKVLRDRVRSYFQPGADDGRRQFRMLVTSVRSLDYIVTDTELEALILEANLIKAHKPRYNISLKDDKKYPFIKVTKEPFPRILVTRDVVKDGGRYFGPYTDVKALRRTLDTLHRLFRVRTCAYDLPNPKVRLCLDYEIKRCDGPCEGLITEGDYKKIIDQAILFLTGRNEEVVNLLRSRMEQAAEGLRFEEAAEIRDRLISLESVTNRQKVVSADVTDWDAVAIAREDDEACGVVMEVRNGRLLGRKNYFLGGVMESPDCEVVSAFVRQAYLDTAFVPGEICLPCDVEDREAICDWLAERAGGHVELRVPQRGDKVKLMGMAANNAHLLLMERRLRRENRKQQVPHAVAALQRDLRLPRPPRRIEAVDISNTQGTDPVAALVCFVDGRPKKGDYRRFRITEVAGPDDFAMMRHVVTRRLKRLMEEGEAFPDLLLVDGGKGQLSSAMEALAGLGVTDLPVIGLAKRLEEVFVPDSPDPQNIPKTSSALKLLQAIRDEAHRFAVTYHRTLRGKRQTLSLLDEVEDVGPARKRALLQKFGSVRRIAGAEVAEIASVEGIGARLAERIKEHLNTGKTADVKRET